jgi:hypothetical protein
MRFEGAMRYLTIRALLIVLPWSFFRRSVGSMISGVEPQVPPAVHRTDRSGVNPAASLSRLST